MGKSITDWSSVTTVGLDLAKHVFQVHGVDAARRVVFNKAIKRGKLLAFFAALPQCLLLWQSVWIDRRNWIPESGLQ